MTRLTLHLAGLLGFLAFTGLAQTDNRAVEHVPGEPPRQVASDLTNLPALKAVSPGVFDLGPVRLSKPGRTVSFPAVLNRTNVSMEYFLVTTYGKTHESILRTDVAPLYIHVAMLLLNAKGADTNSMQSQPREYGGTPGLTVSGDPISIEVTWQDQGREIRRSAEEMVFNHTAGAPMTNGGWVYNGSGVWRGTFMAQQSGSLISLIPDPSALANDTVPSSPDGPTSWLANREKLPPANVPLRITIKLLDPPPEKPQEN